MPTNETDKKQQAEGWISRLLTGWGIPGSIARIIAGALVGAVAAWIAVTQSGCTASLTTNSDGSLQYRGSVGVSTVTK